MKQCSDCGKDISEDEAIHCLFCGAAICEDCEVGGFCSACAQIVEAEEDLEAEEGFW